MNTHRRPRDSRMWRGVHGKILGNLLDVYGPGGGVRCEMHMGGVTQVGRSWRRFGSVCVCVFQVFLQ